MEPFWVKICLVKTVTEKTSFEMKVSNVGDPARDPKSHGRGLF